MTDSNQKPDDTNILYLPVDGKANPSTHRGAGRLLPTQHYQLQAALQPSCTIGSESALLVVNIGGYGVLAETFGSAFSEELSSAVDQRLRACLRDYDVAVRVGADEFAVVLSEVGSVEEVCQMAQRLVARCGERIDLNGLSPMIKTTVGIAMCPADTSQVDELLHFARIALQRAQAGNQSWHLFSEELLNRQQHKVCTKAELEDALREDRFILHYQPQYAADSQEIVGVEALVRMTSGSGELIMPDQFIPVAEDNGFIVKLGHWVIREACGQLATWREAGCGSLRVAVNVSPRQLVDRHLIDVIDDAVSLYGLDYSDLELEVTEQCMFDHLHMAKGILQELHVRGVRIAVDDFGTGYSSFSYLAELPLNVVKMDRSFLAKIATQPRARKVVSAMIAMARELDLEVLAEGVETQQQYEFLQSNGCHLCQGYGLARPQAAAAVAELLMQSEATAIAG